MPQRVQRMQVTENFFSSCLISYCCLGAGRAAQLGQQCRSMMVHALFLSELLYSTSKHQLAGKASPFLTTSASLVAALFSFWFIII